MAEKRICLGKLAGTHGVKGLVKVKPLGDNPMLIFDITPLYTSEAGPDTLDLIYKNPQGQFFLAAIEGVTNKEDAAALGKLELWVERSALPEIEPEESGYYYEDLIGLDVLSSDGAAVGTVIAVENFGASDLLEIKPKIGAAFYIPFTEQYVPHIGDTITLHNHEDFMI